MLALWIILGVVVLVVVFAVLSYNNLVRLRETVRSAWAQIDVMLQRRHDLIPNLVETVKGYAGHEKQTLENVVAARNQALAARGSNGNLAQQVQAEAALGGALGRLLAVAEAYPDLKANTNFLQLQGELSATENGIASQRQGYNAVVAQYNASILSFPSNLIAGPFGFTPQPFFEVPDAAVRSVPVVKF